MDGVRLDLADGRCGATAYCLLPLHAVLRAGLLAIADAGGVERPAHDLVAHARQVLDAATAHQHDRVLLQVVALARDVAVTSMPPEIRTRATLRSAEFGFFGVVVHARAHATALRGGHLLLAALAGLRPGVDSFLDFGVRPLRTSWLVVGMRREMVANCGLRPWPGGESGTGPSWYRYARQGGPTWPMGRIHSSRAQRSGHQRRRDRAATARRDAPPHVPQRLLGRPSRAIAAGGAVAWSGARVWRRRGVEPLQRSGAVGIARGAMVVRRCHDAASW